MRDAGAPEGVFTNLFVSYEQSDRVIADPRVTGVTIIGSTEVGRGVAATIAAGQRSYLGVCLASPTAWVLAAALLIAMYYYIVKIDLKKIFPDKKVEDNIS